VIDSGIFVRKDTQGHYAGNAGFNGAGYTMPTGYPKGDTRFHGQQGDRRPRVLPPERPRRRPATRRRSRGRTATRTAAHAGTVACNAGTPVTFQGANVTLSGIAPRAYLMKLPRLLPSQTNEDFQNGNATPSSW